MPEDTPEVKCTMCGWEGSQRECTMGHEDLYCPECGYESIESVEDDNDKVFA